MHSKYLKKFNGQNVELIHSDDRRPAPEIVKGYFWGLSSAFADLALVLVNTASKKEEYFDQNGRYISQELYNHLNQQQQQSRVGQPLGGQEEAPFRRSNVYVSHTWCPIPVSSILSIKVDSRFYTYKREPVGNVDGSIDVYAYPQREDEEGKKWPAPLNPVAEIDEKLKQHLLEELIEFGFEEPKTFVPLTPENEKKLYVKQEPAQESATEPTQDSQT